jgi:ankyrin repeat protein
MGNALGTKAKKQETPLLKPAMEGDLESVKELVAAFRATDASDGASPELQAFVDEPDKAGGNNAVHGAVFAGHLDVLQYLVEDCGASLTLSNTLGCFPLWLAAGYDRVGVLAYILEKTADVPQALLHTNSSGDTPLIAAASRGNFEACKLLLEAAASTDAAAAVVDVEELMTTGNRNGDTALKVAISIASQEKDTTALIDLLLAHATERVVNKPNHGGLTPLLVACERDDATLFQKLVDRKANVTVQDAAGASPLAVAAFCGSKQVLAVLLLNITADRLEQPNTNGCTPLWLAARSGRPDVVEMLLQAGADPTAANKEGLSPLDVAVKYKREPILTLLTKKLEES